MALTLSKTRDGAMGDLKYWIGTATFDSSYATGGESLTAANLGLSSIDFISLTPDTLTSTTGVLLAYDFSAEKILVFEPEDTSNVFQERGADDLSALVVTVFALGKQ